MKSNDILMQIQQNNNHKIRQTECRSPIPTISQISDKSKNRIINSHEQPKPNITRLGRAEGNTSQSRNMETSKGSVQPYDSNKSGLVTRGDRIQNKTLEKSVEVEDMDSHRERSHTVDF